MVMVSEDIVFVNTFYQALEKEKISYCILRNADEVEQGDAHDIDMTVELAKMAQAFKLMFSTAKELGWRLHLKTGSERDKNNIKSFHFYKVVDDKLLLVHIDFFPTFTWNGMILLNNNDLLENLDASSLYHTANPGVGSVTKLFIRLLHNGHIKMKYKDYILETFLSYKELVITTLQKFLPEERAYKVYELVTKSQWSHLENNRKEIIADIVVALKKKRDYHVNKLLQKKYLVGKAMKKVGLMIVFEGTDGSGKTTIINSLSSVLGRTFNEDFIDYYHWRPGFIKSPKKESNVKFKYTEPHKDKPYGKLLSIGKFLFFNLDYILGYWFKIRVQLSKGHLVVFDRYYYDYYLDKIRYRLNISDRILDIFKVFIPKPDITFLLVGDPKVLYDRKKEISVEEIKIQISRLMKNKSKFHNSIIIDVNQNIEAVVNEVCKNILYTCSMKYHK